MARFGYKKSIANTYQANRSFDNELFKHKKQPKKRKMILAFLFILALIGGAGWLLTRPFFYLQMVEVQGAETIDPYILSDAVTTALEQDKRFSISRLHILRRQDQKVDEALSGYSFSSINVQKKKRSLLVTVQEQAQGGLIHATNTWMLYSLKGEYVRDLTEEEVSYVASVINGTPTEKPLFYRDTPIIEFGDQNLVPEKSVSQFVQIKKMHDSLIQSGHRPVMHIISNEQLLWAEARMGGGHRLLYDLERDTQTQVEQYLTIERELRNSSSTVSTIDVRFEGRVYTK